MKAQIASVDLGFIKFDGLMMPDGEYAIAVPQVSELFQFLNKNTSRDFKALLGNDFQFLKASTELSPKQVNTLSIKDFSLLAVELSAKGHVIAKALNRAFVEESVARRFDTAFGKKVSEAEYNEQLAFRYKRLLSRRLWTDVLQERHIQCFGVKPKPAQFRGWTVRANEVLFGKKHFNCDRDNMEQENQHIIESFEFMAVRRSKQNPKANPDQLLELALDTF